MLSYRREILLDENLQVLFAPKLLMREFTTCHRIALSRHEEILARESECLMRKETVALLTRIDQVKLTELVRVSLFDVVGESAIVAEGAVANPIELTGNFSVCAGIDDNSVVVWVFF